MYFGILLLVWYVGRVVPMRGRITSDNGDELEISVSSREVME